MTVAQQPNRDPAGRRKDGFAAAVFLHPAAILAIAFVVAGAVFLSGAEIPEIGTTVWSLVTLLIGAALLFVVGMYFTARLAAYQSHADLVTAVDATADDLARMRAALTARIAEQAPDRKP